MIIRKRYKTEGPAHIVRNCTTDRCSKSLHGHSYLWDVKLEGSALDNGGMLVDFGIMKHEIGAFLDMFDHCQIIWDQDTDTEFFWNYSDRIIKVPFSPSAENMSIFVYAVVKRIIQNTQFANGEIKPVVHSVTCHETLTGYAEAFDSDTILHSYYSLNDIKFKHDKGIWKSIINGDKFYKDTIPVQVIDTRKGKQL